MFTVDFGFGIALYLGMVIFIIAVCWVFGESRKRTFSKYSDKEKFIWQCEICTYTYVDSKNLSISQCPRCGSYNENKKELELKK